MKYIIQNKKNYLLKVIDCSKYTVHQLDKIYRFYSKHKLFEISVLE